MGQPTSVDRVLSLEVPLIVLVGERQMRLSEVVALIPGAIIELPKGSEEELQLLANNKAIAMGVAVKVGENFGIRISYVGDLKERIKALGPPATPTAPAKVPSTAAAPTAPAEPVLAATG